MGSELLWGLGLAAAGAGLKASDNVRVSKAQDRAVAQGLASQSNIDQQAQQRVQQQVQTLAASTPEEEKKKSVEAFMAQLRANQQQAHGPATVGATSDRFTGDVSAARDAVQSFGADQAQTAAEIRAPIDQRVEEGQQTMRLGSELEGLSRKSDSAAFLAQLKAKSVRQNPWMQGLGDVLSAAGTMYGGGAGVGGALAGGGMAAGTSMADWGNTRKRQPTTVRAA